MKRKKKDMKIKKMVLSIRFNINIFFLYLIISIILSNFSISHSEEKIESEIETTIESDLLRSEGMVYHLRGNVVLRRLNTTIMAQSATYHRDTGKLYLEGDIYYDDEDVIIRAEKADLNLKEKTGILINGEIFFKKEELKVVSPEIQRLSENHYILKKALVTTCTGSPPAWCFKGRDVDLVVGERLRAKDVTFNIKGIPVFYSPYLWAPALTERKSGMLIPSVAYSKELGFSLRQPLYIVTTEHSDITLNIDLYTENGIGEGLEYRWRGYPGDYIDTDLYHIRDSSLKKDFIEINVKQNMEHRDEEDHRNLREFLNLNLLNQEEYLRIMSPFTKMRLTRFVDSTSEVSYKSPSLNLYTYGEYIQDLTMDTSRVSQRLPVTGVNIYPLQIFSSPYSPHLYMESSFSNFLRQEGMSARRIYLEPGILHSYGKVITLSQNLNTKILKYYTADGEFTSSFIDYRATLKTELSKDFSTLTHTIEPELSYYNTGIMENNSTIDEKDFFDTKDLFKKRSIIELSLLSRFYFREDSSRFFLRFTQPYDTISERYQPLKGEVSVDLKRFYTKLNSDYDHHTQRLETISSTAGIRFHRLSVYVSERYISPDILFMSTGLMTDITKSITLNSTLWYDMKGGGLRDITTDLSLKRQCWTLNLRWIQGKKYYFIGFSIGLKGLYERLIEYHLST